MFHVADGEKSLSTPGQNCQHHSAQDTHTDATLHGITLRNICTVYTSRLTTKSASNDSCSPHCFTELVTLHSINLRCSLVSADRTSQLAFSLHKFRLHFTTL